MSQQFSVSDDDGTRLCVVGNGQMGVSIAQLAILNNIKTVIVLRQLSNRARILKIITNFVDRQVKKSTFDSKISHCEGNNTEAILKLLTLTTDLKDAVLKSNFVIEAIVEQEEAKVNLFRTIQSIKQDVLIATNTSAISITSIAGKLEFPENLCGLHFFIPVHVKKFVELPITPYTSSKTVDKAAALVRLLGKQVVQCKDSPGFVVNRLFVPMLNAAHRLIDDGVVQDHQQVDELIKDCLGWKMGPFEVSDFVGLESLDNIIREIGRQLPERTIIDSPILKIAANNQKATGMGFYNQNDENIGRK